MQISVESLREIKAGVAALFSAQSPTLRPLILISCDSFASDVVTICVVQPVTHTGTIISIRTYSYLPMDGNRRSHAQLGLHHVP